MNTTLETVIAVEAAEAAEAVVAPRGVEGALEDLAGEALLVDHQEAEGAPVVQALVEVVVEGHRHRVQVGVEGVPVVLRQALVAVVVEGRHRAVVLRPHRALVETVVEVLHQVGDLHHQAPLIRRGIQVATYPTQFPGL